MLVDITLGNKAVWRILILLSETPGAGITRPEIREHTLLGNRSIDKALFTMEANGLISKEKTGGKFVYKLKLTNSYVLALLEICKLEKDELNNLSYSVSLVLREAVRKIIDVSEPVNIYLFGSFAKRIHRVDSDIDLALVGSFDANSQLLIEAGLEEVSKRFNKELQVHYFSVSEFKNTKNKLVMEIIKDKVSLLG